MDTDTIGLIVLLSALVALLVAASGNGGADSRYLSRQTAAAMTLGTPPVRPPAAGRLVLVDRFERCKRRSERNWWPPKQVGSAPEPQVTRRLVELA
jgi:hypothetical protein